MTIERLGQKNFIEICGQNFEYDEEGYVFFGDVSDNLLNQQSQYASRYAWGAFGEYPNLGEGLRFKGDFDDYHFLKIHKDDIQTFVDKVTKHKEAH